MVRCDHGPHGYLAIAGHAHADALSIEVRHAGVDLLVDPGTYCYLTDPVARRYFRSTVAHNTLEIGGTDSATYGGSFLWLDGPNAEALSDRGLGQRHGGALAARGTTATPRKAGPADPRTQRDARPRRAPHRHRRPHRGAGQFRRAARLSFGPAVEAHADGDGFALAWQANGRRYTGRLTLPTALGWQVHRGAADPMLGWYSSAFHEKEPSTSLIGSGTVLAGKSGRSPPDRSCLPSDAGRAWLRA